MCFNLVKFSAQPGNHFAQLVNLALQILRGWGSSIHLL